MIYRPGFWTNKIVNGLGFLGSIQQLKRMSREPSLGHLSITKLTRKENALGIEIDVRRPSGDPTLTSLSKMHTDINFWTLKLFLSLHNHIELMDSHGFYCLEAHNPYHWYYLPQRDVSFFCTMHWLSDGLKRTKEIRLFHLNSSSHATIKYLNQSQSPYISVPLMMLAVRIQLLGLPADQQGIQYTDDTRTRFNWEAMITALQTELGDIVLLQIQNLFDKAANLQT